MNEHEKYIAIWSKAVDTQMHFNEMSVKSRQLGLTFVAAALGTGVVLLAQGNDFALDIHEPVRFRLHISVVLVLAAWLALAAVRRLDLNVYHRMLRGAVTFGEDFEANYMSQIFDLEKGMTQAISHFSRYDDAKVEKSTETARYTYKGTKRVTAEDKIKTFYHNTILFLVLAALALFILTNMALWTAPAGG